jgi:hypothetical protein
MSKLPLYHPTNPSLIGQVRFETGALEPPSAGDDRLINAYVAKFLSDAQSQMVAVVGGLPAYLQFTVTSAEIYTVTYPTAGTPPTIAKAAVSYPHEPNWLTISNAKAYGDSFINHTSGLSGAEKILTRVDRQADSTQNIVRNSAQFIRYYDVMPLLGFTLLPPPSATNTIGMYYRRSGDEFAYVGTGLTTDTATIESVIPVEFERVIVSYACSRVFPALDDDRAAQAYAIFMKGMEDWKEYAASVDLGVAITMDNPVGDNELLGW